MIGVAIVCALVERHINLGGEVKPVTREHAAERREDDREGEDRIAGRRSI